MKITKIHKPHNHYLIYIQMDNGKEYSLSHYFEKIGYTNDYDLNKIIGVQLRPKRRHSILNCHCEFEGYFEAPIYKVKDIVLQDLLQEEIKDGMVYSQLNIDYFMEKLKEYGFMGILEGV